MAVLVCSFVVGFALFIATGATTDKGTTGSIRAESSLIMIAEKTHCLRYGTYASIPTLEREHLLDFKPSYNSVVIVPGSGCGTLVIGSPQYESPAG